LRWAWDGVTFAVLHPAASIYDEPAAGRGARKENDRCCVLRVASAGAAALLPGDAEARSEREMLAREIVIPAHETVIPAHETVIPAHETVIPAKAGTQSSPLHAEVLVIPHHGSRTSSTAAFIEAVSPSIGILSVGYRNRFHHPNATVVARYIEHGVVLRRTDEEGALRIVLPSSPAPPRVERLVHPGYWSDRKGR
jgi:competence protein ComEC